MSLLSIGPSFVLIAFSVWTVIDIVLTRKERIRNFHKIFWLFVAVVLGPAAGLSWLWIGRPRKVGFVPGGKDGPVANLVGLSAPAGAPSPARSNEPTAPTGLGTSADQRSLQTPTPEAATVID